MKNKNNMKKIFLAIAVLMTFSISAQVNQKVVMQKDSGWLYATRYALDSGLAAGGGSAPILPATQIAVGIDGIVPYGSSPNLIYDTTNLLFSVGFVGSPSDSSYLLIDRLHLTYGIGDFNDGFLMIDNNYPIIRLGWPQGSLGNGLSLFMDGTGGDIGSPYFRFGDQNGNFLILAPSFLQLNTISATTASALTPAEGMVTFVSTTNGTFTSIGLWDYENGAWHKL